MDKILKMGKIINPCMCKVYGNQSARAFVKIKYVDGRLSFCGVIGPMKNGNAKGACGQCTDEIRAGIPVKGWNREMLDKLCQVWDEWHLNSARPYCQHQKELGWDKLARKKVTLYNYRLTKESMNKKENAEEEALLALREGRKFMPTEDQILYANMPYSIRRWEKLRGKEAERYEPKKPLYPGDEGETKIEALGWLHPEEHPEGILGKPCPICDYIYGSSWCKEDVPKEIIDWLFSLPEAEVKPAWV